LAVGKQRSHPSVDVSNLAKEIVKKWKSSVEKEKLAAGGKNPPAVIKQNGKLGV